MHGNEHGNSMLTVKCQPSIVQRQHQGQMEVEAAIQLAHDLDKTGVQCVCIGVGLLGVLLDLLERI